MKIVIFDYRIFSNDILLSTISLEENSYELNQFWSKSEIKEFCTDNQNSLWVWHSNEREIPFLLSKANFVFDLMKIGGKNPFSIDMVKFANGSEISECPLTETHRTLKDEEKELIAKYHREDLFQVRDEFFRLKDKILVRFDLLREFNIPLSHISDTEAQLGAMVLGAKRIHGIENKTIKPKLYDNLRLKNENLKAFYLNEDFKTNKNLNEMFCGTMHTFGNGGVHAAIPRSHFDNALYFDVSGFYNLIMINYDLLPRTLNDEGRKRYIHCYEEQLRLKKINPKKRGVYKIVLLTVYGGEKNKYTDFYDPAKGDLVCAVGQVFFADLLEKLEDYVICIQSNTDGIIVKPKENITNEQVISIVEEWEKRTGFVIKKVPITDIWQRDVNCYMYRQEGKIHVCGEYGLYNAWEDIFERGAWQTKEPPIISHCVVEYLMNDRLPEDVVEENKHRLRMFQYITKNGSYDYTIIENAQGEQRRLQNVNRCFAYNGKDEINTIVKVKENPYKRAKVANMPPNVFISNEDIRGDNHNDTESKIDYDYYVYRSYEKIKTFLPIDD